MSRPRVFVFAPADGSDESRRQLEAAGCEVVTGETRWLDPRGSSEADLIRLAEGSVALAGATIRPNPISRRVMESAPDLRIVAKYSIGVDDVDLAAASDLGALVTHCPTESNWSGVAEGTLAMILALTKRVRERDRQVKAGAWRDHALEGRFLGARHDGYAGLTIGILGLGRVGARVADLLAPWRVRLLACDPYVDPSKFVIHGAGRADLATLLAESDILTIHVTLTPETERMIGAAQLAAMKPTAVLINTARGPVIDEDALAAALEEGVIAAAGLDVFAVEPLPGDSPLRRLGDKVLLAPHMVASNLGSGLRQGVEWATRSVLSALAGELPDNVYNRDVIERWRARFAGKSLL
jgi:phosphoglycerate dehydrogenase-like enzyme